MATQNERWPKVAADSVPASGVTGLAAWITAARNTLDGLLSVARQAVIDGLPGSIGTYVTANKNTVDGLYPDADKTKLAAIVNPLLWKAGIAVAADFPTPAAVQIGWVYTITATVTDNDATKTNTGDSFVAGDEIGWDGSGWVLLQSQRVATINLVAADSPYTLADTSLPAIIACDTTAGPITVNLPSVSAAIERLWTRIYTELGTDPVYVVPFAGQTIRGEAQIEVGRRFGAVTLYAHTYGSNHWDQFGSTEDLSYLLAASPLLTPDIAVVVDGANVYAEVEANGGGDLPVMIGATTYALDCTTGAGTGGKARALLTQGASATDLKVNYLYVELSGATAVLAASATRPTGDKVLIGRVVISDAATTTADKAFAQQLSTLPYEDSAGAGLLSTILRRLRLAGPVITTGVTPTSVRTPDGAALDSISLSVTPGTILNPEPITWPARTVAANSAWIANLATGLYTEVNDLNECLYTAAGAALTNNQRTSLTIWASVSEDDDIDKLFVNLSSGTYLNDTQCYYDHDNLAVTTIPEAFRETGFLLCRIPIKYTSAAGGTIEFVGTLLGLNDVIDLRGITPGYNASGSTVSTLGLQDETYQSAASDPTANNDTVDTAALGESFRAGDFWLNLTTDVLWVCVDATATAAIWRSVKVEEAIKVIGTKSANFSVSFNDAKLQTVTLGGDLTISTADRSAPINREVTLIATTDATPRTIAWEAGGLWRNGVQPTAFPANSVWQITLLCTGANAADVLWSAEPVEAP